MTADDWTSPERSAQMRQAKRLRSALRQRGLCFGCLYRERNFEVYHCLNKPDRQNGQCQLDGKSPTFKVDDKVLQELSDDR